MASNFLLLELIDPEIKTFLWSIRHILTGQLGRGPIHVTLRGPYEDDTPPDTLESTRATLRHDVIRVSGVGRFSNPSEEVVFLGVDSPHLRSVWWKPSFPIEIHGFKPHVSVYRGSDTLFADRTADFLASQDVELLCAEHDVVWHLSRQPSLFTRSEPTVGELSNLYGSHRIDVDFLDRLRGFVDQYRAEKRAAEIAVRNA